MAATTAGAVKALIETFGLAVPVYRDTAPDGQAAPYITVSEAVAVTVEPSGDFGGGDTYVTELAQVDVWQPTRNPDMTVGESYTLTPTLLRGLQGGLLNAPTHVYGMSVDSHLRLVERDTNITHTAITVRLRRKL